MDPGQILALLFGLLTAGVSWIVRGKVEEWQKIRERLRAEQRGRYAQVLNPYIQIFAGSKGAEEAATAVIKSQEYRKELFDFALVADDDVIRAYNDMMRRFNVIAGKAGSVEAFEAQGATIDAIAGFGTLLLELRKSVGNHRTQLRPGEILEAVGVTAADEILRDRQATAR